jgi:hypothetical protein
MKVNLKLATRLSLFVTPLVTGSVFVALPSLAATLASSNAAVSYSNFSKNPLTIYTITDTQTSVLAPDGQVTANAEANAAFITDPDLPLTQAFNTSSSIVQGNGNNYFGQANSLAGIIGYDFVVGQGETFSFNFNALLDINASSDSLAEKAKANGAISFQLLDTTDSNNTVVLDFFNLSGQVNTAVSSDFLDVEKSDNFAYNPDNSSFNTSFGGLQESANVSVQGFFSRLFNSVTRLTLAEFKVNEVQASCSTPLPF